MSAKKTNPFFMPLQNTPYLKSLNEKQRKAVEAIYGTVLVLAGPGTGKTHMLTARIAHILNTTDANPENILCLTFTEHAAVEMRIRLQRWIGAAAYRVRIHTFHGFCERVMNGYPEIFWQKRGEREVADDLQKALIFRQIIDARKWEYFRPFGDRYYWQGKFLKTISDLKREYYTPEKLRSAIPEEKERLESDDSNYYQRDSKYGKKGEFKPSAREKIDRKVGMMEELSVLWEAYEQEMRTQKLYDFDDQLLWVVAELATNKELKSDLQEQYQFLLVDEYQDTNTTQNELLWGLTDFFDEPNLLAVGDDDQSIFRFQGASIANVLEFQTRFPKAEIITLTENYRSAQAILDTAYSSVAHNLERMDSEKSLISAGENKSYTAEIERAVFLSRFSELVALGDRIQSEISTGTAPAEIAVICRENREVREVAHHLTKQGIRVSYQGGENIFEDGVVKYLILMLRVFSNPSLDHELYDLLHAPFFAIDRQVLMNLLLELKREGKSLVEVLENQISNYKLQITKDGIPTCRDEKMSRCAGLDSRSESGMTHPTLLRSYGGQAGGILEMFRMMNVEYHHASPAVVAEKLFHSSGMAAWLTRSDNEDKVGDLLKVRKLLEWIDHQSVLRRATKDREDEKVESILEKIDLHRELGIPVFPDPRPAQKNSVQIMTAHKAKGLEFDVVCILGLVDGVWGNKRKQYGIPTPEISKTEHDPNEEERRLFFVALTRARKRLWLSYAEKDISATRERMASQFWHEVPFELVVEKETDAVEAKAQELLPVFFSTESPQFTAGEQETLRTLASRHVWSATSLQDMLDCPRKFLYIHLLKVPSIRTKQMGYGIALHEALEEMGREYFRTKKLISGSELLTVFEQALKQQNLIYSEYEESLDRGKEILSAYYEQKKNSWPEKGMVEFNFRDRNVVIENIPVTGRIDKIELSPDGKEGILVDYKSGRARPIIQGERFWRQLVFYDLLARNAKGLPFQIRGCELEFLTPDDKGKFPRKTLEVTDEDRTQVITELKEVHNQLMNLEFPMQENVEGDSDINYWQKFGGWEK